MLQNVIELPIGEGSFLVIFVFIALILMTAATYLLFMAKRGIFGPGVSSGGVQSQSMLKGFGFTRSKLFILLVTFGLMVSGMVAFVGYFYVTTQPVVADYFWNLIAVAFIASIIGVIVAYGVATLGLYSKGLIK
jgi:hypothetical protein